MLNNFLKKQEYTKLKLLQYVGNKQKTNIQELMITFNLSRASIKRSIIEINIFLDSSPDLSLCNIIQDQLFNFSLETSSEQNLTTIYHRYLDYLLCSSLSFQIMIIILNNTSISVNKLSSLLYVSNNHCYKIIDKLNKYLKFYQLTILIQNNRVEIEGEEHNIRFMYWNLLFSGWHNINWPLKRSTHTLIKNSFSIYRKKYLLNKPLSTKVSTDFYLAILYERLNKGHYQTIFKTLSTSIIQAFSDVNDITSALNNFPMNTPTIKNKEIELNERKAFNLIMRVIDSEIDSSDNKIDIGKKLLKLNNPVTLFHKKLNTDFISIYFKKDVENLLPIFMYYTVLYHQFSFTYSYSQTDVINKNPLNNGKLIHMTSDFSLTITNFIRIHAETYPTFSFSLSQATLEILGLLHYSLYISYFKDSLSIFVHYSKSPIGKDFIKGKLRHIFNEKSLTFTSDSEQADIIISDSIEAYKATSHTFFLEDIYNVTLWKELYAFIQSLLFELYHL
ncbi:helix-turn-helix domain-containing protein [Carnobacterium maltaromaticum]|uniref:helix-turn-helix domain-containing protein n=1 Tax=Carnobacterium maltaromaticum TaxID=2751 RepID=UPI0039BE7128